jgi:hypothetical protein
VRAAFLLTVFSRLHLILNRYLSVFLISVTFVQFNTFVWTTSSFILNHSLPKLCSPILFPGSFHNRRICLASPLQGRLPLSNTLLIPLNIQIPAFYHTISLFYLFCSFQRNSLHLSFIPIRSNIARKPSDWCRQINSVFLHLSTFVILQTRFIYFSLIIPSM